MKILELLSFSRSVLGSCVQRWHMPCKIWFRSNSDSLAVADGDGAAERHESSHGPSIALLDLSDPNQCVWVTCGSQYLAFC